jgi:hypothetical protein
MCTFGVALEVVAVVTKLEADEQEPLDIMLQPLV